MKKNIEPLSHGLDWLLQMKPSVWDWNSPEFSYIPGIGPGTAEQLDSISPLLAKRKDGEIKTSNDRGVLAVAVLAIQELTAKVSQLEAELAKERTTCDRP